MLLHTRLLLLLSIVLVTTGCPGGWSPAFDAGANWYMNVWGLDENTVYAVGGTPEKGAAMRFDGAAWVPVELGVEVPILNWAYGFAPDDVFAVGEQGTILHFDGAQWVKATPLTQQPLWGVWGAAPNDVWAVGGSGFSSGEPILLHYDGAAWTQHPAPTLTRQNVFAFFKVWGTSADNVLVVGQGGAVIRWNGTEWLEEDAGPRDDLISLWGTGPDNIVAVGGRGNGLAAVWNGSEWRSASLSPLPGLNGVWTDSKDHAWIAGGTGTVGRLNLQTLEVTPDEVDTALELHSIYGVEDRLYTVGGNLLTGASTRKYQGIALERPQ